MSLQKRLQSAVGTLENTEGEAFSSLAALTDITGALHEHQIEQLKLYGLACSQAVVEASFEPDHDTRTIKYLLVVDPKKIEPDLGRRMAFLKKAVAVILQGWEATVRFRQVGTVTHED